jgi:hypothetical protein
LRALFLCLLLSPLMLAGCNAVTRQDSDFFQAGGASQAQFDNDDRDCRTQAENYVGYDLHGMSGTRYDQNRAYNATYMRCMSGRGYQPRPYYQNWLPG